MKVQNARFGSYVVWSDFIRAKKLKDSDTILYSTFLDKVPNSSERHIALYVEQDSDGFVTDIYIAVAVNKKTTVNNPNWWKFIVEHRINYLITNKGNMAVGDRGLTRVPPAYIDLLSEDPMAYANIYGPIDQNTIDKAIGLLTKADNVRSS